MPVNISALTLSVPAPASPTDPEAVLVSGAEALAKYPDFVAALPDGSVRLFAPTKAATTESVKRTRCEWRENEYWTLDSAPDHWSKQEMMLTKINSAGRVVIAQAHVKNSNRPLLKVFWDKGDVIMGYRLVFNQKDPENVTLLSGVKLNQKFEVVVHLSSSGALTVRPSINGKGKASVELQLDPSWTKQKLVFHGGIYNQIDYDAHTPVDEGTISIIDRLTLAHE
ncbi:polysaccharide lyase family 7 protein [Pseudomonas mangiferae]|uniref:Polysaccharide lyase family 7 protein n=1 Tax=Pseudomonas mangiferae TaxID=2593654 RepID=A0A553H1M3_9PSED|nr:polysaccharide lyase family 7 protein [Pseudomonas mangiferae]TRX75658.1 polysaccharide lyase family 7 protein [Pseudomonas mangiferae]